MAPRLNAPSDTYLSHWRRGGQAQSGAGWTSTQQAPHLPHVGHCTGLGHLPCGGVLDCAPWPGALQGTRPGPRWAWCAWQQLVKLHARHLRLGELEDSCWTHPHGL